MVANEEKVKCIGRCEGLKLTIRGYLVQVDFYILPVIAFHAVLGVQWLATLELMEMDYQAPTMKFTKDAVVHQLQGTKPDTLKELYGKGLHCLIWHQIPPIDSSH